jgi:hypothetical protein
VDLLIGSGEQGEGEGEDRNGRRRSAGRIHGSADRTGNVLCIFRLLFLGLSLAAFRVVSLTAFLLRWFPREVL